MRSQEVNGDGKDKNYNKIQTTGGNANRDGDNSGDGYKIFYRVILYFERIFHARYVCTQ